MRERSRLRRTQRARRCVWPRKAIKGKTNRRATLRRPAVTRCLSPVAGTFARFRAPREGRPAAPGLVQRMRDASLRPAPPLVPAAGACISGSEANLFLAATLWLSFCRDTVHVEAAIKQWPTLRWITPVLWLSVHFPSSYKKPSRPRRPFPSFSYSSCDLSNHLTSVVHSFKHSLITLVSCHSA